MTANQKSEQAKMLYLLLAAVFISALVSCNLIFLKFFSWTPFEWLGQRASADSVWYSITHYTFYLSVGLLPYPITFLATDLISEIYGRKRANQVVIAGLIASLFTLCIVSLADSVSAMQDSAVDDQTFHTVFGLARAGVFASMMAYLFAQFIDIRLFHFWKKKTNGKKLWLRNNLSTIPSQLIDSAMVVGLLCMFGALPSERFGELVLNGFLFKVLFALIDTPLFYLTTRWICAHFGLKRGTELLNI